MRRLFRLSFSLRGLLLAASLLCVGLGAFGAYARPYLRQAHIERQWQEYGAWISSSPGPRPLTLLFGEENAVRITRIDFQDVYVNDDNLQLLEHTPELESIDLRDRNISDEGLEQFENLTSLRMVDLSGTKVTEVGLSKLANCPLLRLSLEGTRVTDDICKLLPHFNHLHYLHLGQTHISGRTIRSLGPWCKQLRALYLDGCVIEGRSLSALNDLPVLKTLSLTEVTFTDNSIQGFRSESLRYLYLNKTSFTDEMAADLRKLPNLFGLNLEDTQVGDRSAPMFASFRGLRKLGLKGTRMTAASIPYLSRCRELDELTLSGQAFVPDDLYSLRYIKWLSRLEVEGLQGSDSDLTAIKCALRGLEFDR